MSPDLVSFAIRSLLRLGNAGSEAFAQRARDKAAVFPDLEQPKPDMLTFVTGFFALAHRIKWVSPETAPYAEFWTSHGPDIANPQALDSLYIAIVKIHAEEGVDLASATSADAEATAGLVMLDQWSDANEPVGPLARVLVTVADIALEYVANDPSIAGIDGRGEKLLGAFAGSLSDILPDNGKLGPKDRFAERLFAVALRAGLETISGNTEILADEDHVRDLLDNSLKPVIESLPDDLAGQLDFKRALEAISGPALTAALGTITEYPEAFLGNDFASTTAIGAVTQAVLQEARNTGFAELFNRQGLDTVYKAALGVAASRPELFIGLDARGANERARKLLSGFSRILKQNSSKDSRGVAPQFGAVVLELIQDNVHLYVDQDQEWEALASDLLQGVLTGLQTTLADDGSDPLAAVFSRVQLVELGRIVLNQVAATPSMIAGGNAEVTHLFGMIASLVAADGDLLLTSEDWRAIAGVIAIEAAANPGRLFDLDGTDPNVKLAEQLIRLVIRAASDNMRIAGRAGGAVLFGATLREAIVILVSTTSGNVAAAKERLASIETMVTNLTSFVSTNKDNFGSEEFLALFHHLLIVSLSGNDVVDMTIDVAIAILEGE